MKNRALWITVVVFVILAVIFAFTDWQISQAVYNPEAGWAHIMEAYGQLPAALIGFVSGSLLLRTFKVNKNARSILGVIGISLATIVAAFGFFADAFGAQVDSESINMPLLVGSTVVALILAQVILRRFSPEALSPYLNIAKVGLAVFFVGGILSVWAVKIPWGRWTYRDILAAGDTGLFSPWYLPQGPNGHHSFFSGHTAMCFAVLPLILLVKNGSPARRILLAVLLLWGVIGAASRVVAGAHFASDVLFGAGQTLLWFMIFQKRFISEPAAEKVAFEPVVI